MGMTIDTIIKDCEQSIKQSELFIKTHQANMEIGEIKEYQYYIERDKLTISTMRKYQQLQADYENRLKADMVAMLEDLRLDFQEAELAGVLDNKELIFADEVDDLVQQKINELKAESEPQESEDQDD